MKIRDAYLKGETKKTRLPLAGGARQPLQDRLVGLHAAQARSFLGTRAFKSYKLAELVPYIDWTPFFQTWELAGQVSAHPRGQRGRPGGQEAVRRRAGHAQAHGGGEVADRQRRDRLLAGQCASATTSSCSPTTTRKTRLAMLHTLRQQMARENRRDRANTALADFVAPKETRARRLRRRVRRHGRHRRGRGAGAPHRQDRRLRPHHAEGAGRPPGGGVRRAHARARAPRVLGLRADGDALQRGADRGEVSRHPPGARLSRPARPHREGHDLPAARCRGAGRHQADGELRHVAGRGRVGPLLRRIPRATTSASARSSATRSRTTRGARAGPSRRPSAGWRPCSTTIPSSPAARPPDTRAGCDRTYACCRICRAPGLAGG